jgi:hypothetical protein
VWCLKVHKAQLNNLGRSWKQIYRAICFDQCCWLGAEKLYTRLGGIYKAVDIRLGFCTFLLNFCNRLFEIEYLAFLSFSLQNIRWCFTVPDKSEIIFFIQTHNSYVCMNSFGSFWSPILSGHHSTATFWQQRTWANVNGQHKCLLFSPCTNALQHALQWPTPDSQSHMHMAEWRLPSQAHKILGFPILPNDQRCLSMRPVAHVFESTGLNRRLQNPISSTCRFSICVFGRWDFRILKCPPFCLISTFTHRQFSHFLLRTRNYVIEHFVN